MSRRYVSLVAAVLVAGSAHAAELGYYSQPTLHGDRLVFVSEGDLWTTTVPAPGTPATAHRLTSSDGSESWPVISPDGTQVAFSAEYDGNVDVYIMPIDGGPPKRLTSHPDPDTALAWLPEGRTVVFRSGRAHPHGRSELWRIGTGGGMPRRYEFGECSLISLSTTGSRFAFTRWSNEGWDWKRYRGGTAPEIWVGDFNTGRFAALTDDDASDLFPMWLRGRVYFLSDRTGTANIHSDRPEGGEPTQHTAFAPVAGDPTAVDGYDVRWPSPDRQRRGTRIVFCQAGGLAMLDVGTDEVTRLDVRLVSDRTATRRRFEPVLETLTEFRLAPDGESLLVGSRGEIMFIPVDGAAPRQLTHTSFAREWGAAHLGEEYLVLISDAGGEQQLAIAPLDGSELPSLLTEDREVWLFAPVCSPDGRYVAFADKTMRLHLFDTQQLQRRQVDQAEAGEITDYRFSPDGQWIAYTKTAPGGFESVHVHSIRTSRSFAVSDGLHDDREPRWDPAGSYLFFISRRHLDPMVGRFDFDHVYTGTDRLMAVPLAASIPPPLPDVARAAGFDLEAWAKPAKPDEVESDAAAAAPDAVEVGAGEIEAAAAMPPIRVDTDGLVDRVAMLDVEAGNYAGLETHRGGLTFLSVPIRGLLRDDFGQAGFGIGEATLHRYDLVEQESTTLAEKVAAYTINRRRTTIAVPRAHGFDVLDLSEPGTPAEPEQVELKDARVRVDIRGEWKQILGESWRLQRDFYWAPNMVGVDWPAMRVKYEALLPRIGTRAELNDLVGEMIGELGTSHTYIWGGRMHDRAAPVGGGMLGIDVSPIGGGFRIDRIIAAPVGDGTITSPLAAPHLGVAAGHVILAVDGRPVSPSSNLHDMLHDRAGRAVRLTIADDAAGRNRRSIEVETIRSERQLRYRDWVAANRRYVAEASDGRLGYVHVPNMGGDGLALFSRQFYPQARRTGLVIDVRNNGGGFVSQMIIERLSRRPLGYDQPRHGAVDRYPTRALRAHLATLIDQHAGSDGDIFPASFRAAGLGPLIGTRTWGGVVGIRGDKPFVDFGLSTQPEYAWWDSAGGWSIENRGVAPDIEIDITPEDRVNGRDPQLDRVISYLLERLEAEPIEPAVAPPYPVRGP